jgi:hypothetical protein
MIPKKLTDHCQQHPGCQGCPIKANCQKAISTTTGFAELMAALDSLVDGKTMSDAEFVNALSIPGLGDAA